MVLDQSNTPPGLNDDTIINIGHNISSQKWHFFPFCIIALKSIVLRSSELFEDYSLLLSLYQSRQIQSNSSRSHAIKCYSGFRHICTLEKVFAMFHYELPWPEPHQGNNANKYRYPSFGGVVPDHRAISCASSEGRFKWGSLCRTMWPFLSLLANKYLPLLGIHKKENEGETNLLLKTEYRVK